MKKLLKKVKTGLKNHIAEEVAYIRRLLFPLKLFPLKLIVYFFYYPLKIFKVILIWLIKSIFKAIIWPFRKISNFFKTIFWIILIIYLFFTLVVILDYLKNNYGHYSKFFCAFENINLENKLKTKVVRIVGGYSEGSGFFIEENKVLTNFHVIADEPSPKIIFADGSFETPEKIIGDRNADLAILILVKSHPKNVLELMDPLSFYKDEPLIAVGYALGTDLKGLATIQKGRYSSFREENSPVSYIQTDINLIKGMSGGPLVERCGKVVGVNTMGLSGLSLFIPSLDVKNLIPGFSDVDISKITVDPTTPEGAVFAFYTYLKARRMEEGFNLLSEKYLEKTNFEEWTGRFKNILDVEVFETKLEDKRTNTVFVKFSTASWVNGVKEIHYYEGVWETVLEEGIYKMNKSNIKEVFEPDWSWFFTSES